MRYHSSPRNNRVYDNREAAYQKQNRNTNLKQINDFDDIVTSIYNKKGQPDGGTPRYIGNSAQKLLGASDLRSNVQTARDTPGQGLKYERKKEELKHIQKSVNSKLKELDYLLHDDINHHQK